jgi:hypothetical protein
VLMFSNMHQHLLPWDTLVSRGLYTWLVRFVQKTRYLHPCEAARRFGFGPGFHFSTDIDNDLSALGNSVAPIQVLCARIRAHTRGLLGAFVANLWDGWHVCDSQVLNEDC